MKQIQFIQKSLLLIAALLTLSVACTAQSKEQQETAKAEILHINANYMREHIYDFEAHPDTFVYKGDKPAIIDFYADWCRPCRQLAPKLQQVADRYADQLVVYKVNVDERTRSWPHSLASKASRWYSSYHSTIYPIRVSETFLWTISRGFSAK